MFQGRAAIFVAGDTNGHPPFVGLEQTKAADVMPITDE
jgi:hypothetical protein